MAPPDPKLLTREILLAFWKVHILHHAAEDRVFGQWILTELRRHGYDISPGTLYPLLSRMERNGWLRSAAEPDGGPRGRRYYHLTKDGSAVLGLLRDAVTELYDEVVAEPLRGSSGPPASGRTRRGSRTTAKTPSTPPRARGASRTSRRNKP
jgi:DNA-binding PadR family transcriptional regulator